MSDETERAAPSDDELKAAALEKLADDADWALLVTRTKPIHLTDNDFDED